MKEKIKFFVIEPQILENVILEGVEIDVPEVNFSKAENLKMSEGKPYVLLITSQPFSTITPEALSLSASKEFKQNTKAKALLVNNLPHRIVGNFYMKLKRPAIKTKLFNDREKAIKWLRRELKK